MPVIYFPSSHLTPLNFTEKETFTVNNYIYFDSV